MGRRKLIRVAMAGRRNVGKSTLLNTLSGKRRAITDSIPGLTRDVIEVEVERPGHRFLLSDTPGLDIENPNQLEATILDRAREHLKKVDLILLVLEAPGLHPFDHAFIELLRKNASNTPFLFVVNKVDGEENVRSSLEDFYLHGIQDPVPVSARGRWNLDQLLERMAELVPGIARPLSQEKQENQAGQEDDFDGTESEESEGPEESDDGTDEELDGDDEEGGLEVEYTGEASFDQEDPNPEREAGSRKQPHPKGRKNHDRPGERADANRSTVTSSKKEAIGLAIVGRTNAGKSSLINRLASQELSIVSDIPGTTRDTVDTLVKFKGTELRIIDTAGLRKVKKLKGETKDIEFYSMSRTKRAIRDSHIVIHLIDAKEGLTDFDKKIVDIIEEEGRPFVLAVNKWDAIENKHQNSVRDYKDRLYFRFPLLKKVHIEFISAITGQRLPKLLETCLELYERMDLRIPTSKLNRMVEQWNNSLKGIGQSAKIYYVTQPETSPPLFVFFVSSRAGLRSNLASYFENRIRKEYKLDGVPIRIQIREKENKYV